MAVAYSSDVGKQFVMSHTSVLDDSDVRAQIKAKIQDILEDVAGSDASDEDLNLFGDPLIITKLQSVLNDFYKQGVEKSVAYDALGEAFIQHYGVLGMRWADHQWISGPADEFAFRVWSKFVEPRPDGGRDAKPVIDHE